MKRIEIVGLEGIGEVVQGASVGRFIHDACVCQGLSLNPEDVLVVAHKIVSKAEGRTARLEEIEPSARALELSVELEKDPKLVELILKESRRVIRTGGRTLIVETHHGFICANAGVDLSNAGLGQAVLLPQDPDRSASEIRDEIARLSGVAPGIIISDSFGRPWRLGTTNVALGVAGLEPLKDYRGETDSYGYELKASVAAIADEFAAAASLVMGKKNRLPVVLIRGCAIGAGTGSGRELLRPEEEDLFRRF